LLINNYRKVGYIVGFSAIFLLFTSNLINNQNYLSANPLVNKLSLNQLDRYMVIPVKDTKKDLGAPFTSNPNPEQLGRGCDNNANSNLGIPFICNPSENTEEKSTDGQNNEDRNDKANDRIEKLKERLEKSHSNDDTKAKSESKDLQLNLDVKNNNDKNNDKNNDNNDGNRQLNNQLNIQQNNEDNEGDNDEANTDKGEDKKPSEQQQLLEQQKENKAKDANNGDYEGDDKQESNDEANTDKGEDKKPSEQQQLLEQQEENKAKEQQLLEQQQQEEKEENKAKEQQLLEQQQEEKEENKAKEQQLLEQQQQEEKEENKAKDESSDNDDEKLALSGLDLNIEQKQDKVNKKIEKLEDKTNKENNQLLLKQQEEDKGIDQDNKEQNNYDEEELKITGLDLKIQKIQANLEKKIEKLKDKIENDKDNQRLIVQQEEDKAKDDDDDDDDDGGNKDDSDHETYDGYGFDGDNEGGNNNDDKNFNFAAAGDFGCSKNTQNTVANMEKKEPEIVLALGDLSYHSTADCWFDIMSPLKGKMMITLGSHDTKDGQAKLNQYIKSFELDKPYYSYDYKQVHFLVMATLSDFKEGSEQYNFIKQDLEKASQNKDINWIIVSTYKPLYTSPSQHKAEGEIRDLYHPLFEKYGVDLVLGGHNHNYQRTYPLTFNPDESSKPITTNALTTNYNSNKDGIVFATVGTGGVNFYALDGRSPYMDTQFADKFGFLNIDISNGNPHTKLTGTFYDNRGNEVLDDFTIEKEIKNNNDYY
jgi:Calcineurin-like phosphoesterase